MALPTSRRSIVLTRRLVSDSHYSFSEARLLGAYTDILSSRRYLVHLATKRRARLRCRLRDCRHLASRDWGMSRWAVKTLVWSGSLPGVYKMTF